MRNPHHLVLRKIEFSEVDCRLASNCLVTAFDVFLIFQISRTQGANASSNVSQTFVYQSSLLLVMDNVKIKLVQSGNAYPLTYYPNPHVRNLDNSGKQYRENTSLTFKVSCDKGMVAAWHKLNCFSAAAYFP